MAILATEAGETGGWERRLNVRKRARADALAGLPAIDAAEFSATERDILDVAQNASRRIEAERDAIVQRLETELRRLTPQPPDIDAPIAAARLDLRQIGGRLGPDLSAQRAQVDEGRRQLEAFKDANGLGRPAIYPSSRVLQAGFLMMAAAFEAIFSASLFAETDERGLLGGAVIALGLSGANVTLGFLSGFLGLRYLQHRRMSVKVAGGAALALGIALALALNLFAAAWRNQIAEAGKSVTDTIDSAALFGLTSPQAVILLMLGAGVWVFSALKGYSGFDDPYPDFGKLDRAAKALMDDLGHIREDARDEMEEAVAVARDRVGDATETLRAALAPMRAAYDVAAERVADLDLSLRRTAESGIALIQLYRRENIAARTGPAPTYFADAPPLNPQPANALARAADLLLEAQNAAGAAQAQAGAKIDELSRELEAASADLEHARVRA